MKISEILKKKKTFSFEVFPPKLDQPLEPLLETLDYFEKQNPDFISVTYGSGGTNKGRNNEVCQDVIDRDVTLLSHFVSVGNTKEDVKRRVGKYVGMGAENILAMRGDIPKGWDSMRGEYNYGNELIYDLAHEFPQLCIAGGCYPEKHTEAASLDEDIKIMKLKEECGAEYFISQLCYSTENYEKFLDKCGKVGVKSPIIVGVLPAFSRNGIIKMATLNGCSVPKDLEEIMSKYENNSEDFLKAGKEYTKKLIERYKEIGVDGIHLYTLNRYKDLDEIIREMR